MCRNSVSLLIAILFAIIILSPLTAFSEVTANKLKLKQNPDDTYSLGAEFLSDQETKVKFTLITNYQDGKEIPNSNPLETPDDGADKGRFLCKTIILQGKARH